MANVDLTATLHHLQSAATEQVAQYPQYTGHFAGYKLVKLKRDVKTKAGLAFTQGEYAIAAPRRDEMHILPSSGKFVTVWSRRNKIDELQIHPADSPDDPSTPRQDRATHSE